MHLEVYNELILIPVDHSYSRTCSISFKGVGVAVAKLTKPHMATDLSIIIYYSFLLLSHYFGQN